MSKQIIVVKLGTSVLTSGSAKLDRAHMVELVRQISVLHSSGHRVVLVTSGAIAAGREHLSSLHNKVSDSIANKQMLAAVGQSRLIQVWENLFSIYGLFVGQMLLTRADMEDRERFLNARDTLKSLLDHRIIPIVNENDAVATAEIKVGDNDNLSALVSILAEANKLVLLTDQPGLFTADPRTNPNAQLIEEVQTIDDTLRALAGDSVSGLGTGGMATKLQAADVARRAGIEVIVASGHAPKVVTRVADGERVGTKFTALSSPLENRKRWIFAGPPPNGTLVLDLGACKAVQDKGSSLLPKGVVAINGEFKRGDVLRILDPERQEIARGIARYNAFEMQKIKGQHSDQIDSILGYGYGAVVIHRDDMVLI